MSYRLRLLQDTQSSFALPFACAAVKCWIPVPLHSDVFTYIVLGIYLELFGGLELIHGGWSAGPYLILSSNIFQRCGRRVQGREERLLKQSLQIAKLPAGREIQQR